MVNNLGFLLLLAGLGIALVGGWWLERRARQRIAAALGGMVEGSSVVASRDGVELRVTRATRGSGKSKEHWSYVDAPLPPGESLTLNVVTHGLFERGAIARGTMIDLTTGDEAFDRRYRVEAAPADVALRLLDADVRGYFNDREVELLTEDGRLRLAVRGRLDVDQTVGAVDLARSIIARLRDAHAELDRQAARPLVGAPHRGIPSDAAAQRARDLRADEVARLDRLVRVRARRFAVIQVVAGTLWVAGMVVALIQTLG